MKKPLIIVAAVCIVFLIVSATGLYFLYDHLKDLETRRADIILAVKSALGRQTLSPLTGWS